MRGWVGWKVGWKGGCAGGGGRDGWWALIARVVVLMMVKAVGKMAAMNRCWARLESGFGESVREGGEIEG